MGKPRRKGANVVRSSHASILFTVALLLLLLLGACGDGEPQAFELVLDGAASDTREVPFPIAVLTGRATGVETLTLKISAGDETYTLPLRPGTQMAFRLGGESAPQPVKLEGLETETPTASEIVRSFEERLQASASEAALRKPAGSTAFVVDLPADREDRWPGILEAASPPSAVHFLMEVLPMPMYRSWRDDGRVAPRLEAPPYPWDGSTDAFEAFKEAEVARWRTARDAGQPYEPSRSDLLVLPRAGTEAVEVHDFAVLEWSPSPDQRFDGRMLVNPVTSRDPHVGRPVVLYEIREAWQDRFHAWTEANVGLPMAIVLDWVVRSAPIINSPLRDNVQITLGQGSWSELEVEADALTRTLGGTTEGTPPVLVAVCTWQADGALELLLPLGERVDTHVSLQARGTSPAEQGVVGATLRRVPGLDGAARDAVNVYVAQVVLGALDAESAAPLLRADPAVAVERLVEIANGPASTTRRTAAVHLLGLVDPLSAVAREALVRLVADATEEVAAGAARALGSLSRFDGEAFDALVRTAVSGRAGVRLAARSGLRSHAAVHRSRLLALVSSEDPAERELAVHVLGTSMLDQQDSLSPAGRSALLTGLDDPAPGVRKAALAVLVELAWMDRGSLRSDLPRIAALLADEDVKVRSSAAACLGRFGNEILPIVEPYLASDASGARSAALMTLLGVDAPSAEIVARIEAAKDDASLEVQLTAAMFLAAKRGDVSEALPVARKGLQSDVSIERQLAMGIVWTGGEEAAEAAPWLEPLLDAEEEEVRILAAATLKRIGRETPRSRAVLDEALADPDHPSHGLATNLERQLEHEIDARK